MINREKKSCAICGSDDLFPVLELPKFPFTGVYLKSPDNPKYKGIDQALMLCRECGHGQLLKVVDPSLVYDFTYFHRSSLSPISTSGNDFFAKFLGEVVGDKKFKCILEIGCNDVYLLKKIEHMGGSLFGIDPIWKEKGVVQAGDKIKVLGKFIEELDIEKDLGEKPDLVLSAHTFEHVEDPMEQIRKVVGLADEGALVVIEVPGFDSLLTNNRFDQVFHQHLHYYSLASFERLIHEVGGEYLTHRFNYGYWGGTMLVAFKKTTSKVKNFKSRFVRPNEDVVGKHVQVFREQMHAAMCVIDTLKGETICGYGGAQMLPTIAYHMKSDFAFMKNVLDDNPDRSGLMYPYMPVVIKKPEPGFTLQDVNVLITALDSARPILGRVMSLNAKRIILPLNVL